MKIGDTFSHFGDFCRTTTIHGLLYLTPDYRNLFNRKFTSFKNPRFRFIERLIWSVAVVTGFSWAAYLINQNFEDSNANPIMTTIDTVDVTRVPFPAVTVIPGENPVNPEVDGFTKRLFDYAEFERYNEDDILRCLRVSKDYPSINAMFPNFQKQ